VTTSSTVTANLLDRLPTEPWRNVDKAVGDHIAELSDDRL